jgi:glycosyltransferase involved in cell wall biosynthesis
VRLALVVPGGVDRSGKERVIPALLWLIERLARRHTLHVFALSQEKDPSDYPLLGASIHNLGMPSRSSWPGQALLVAGRRLLRELDRHGPFGLLHAFWANNPGFLSAIAARKLHVPLVLSLGGGELVALKDIGYGSQLLLRERLKVRWSLRSAARVTVASGPMEELARRHGVVPDVVPLGVDDAFFGEQVSTGPPFRLLHVASLNRVKDQGTLLRALRRVVDRGGDVNLDIVGEDTLGGSVQATCAALGLSERVTFHGFLPSDRALPFFRRADLFVLSSRHEAGPLVVLEAAARGVPTVGTAVGHIRDFGPDLSVAVPVGDAAALAEGILSLLSDGERRHVMGEAARRWARAHDANATAAAFERIYAEVRSKRLAAR